MLVQPYYNQTLENGIFTPINLFNLSTCNKFNIPPTYTTCFLVSKLKWPYLCTVYAFVVIFVIVCGLFGMKRMSAVFCSQFQSYMCFKYHLASVVTWHQLSLGISYHLASVVTWHQLSLGVSCHLASVVTWHQLSFVIQFFTFKSSSAWLLNQTLWGCFFGGDYIVEPPWLVGGPNRCRLNL